jgi:hypothetical protein
MVARLSKERARLRGHTRKGEDPGTIAPRARNRNGDSKIILQYKGATKAVKKFDETERDLVLMFGMRTR